MVTDDSEVNMFPFGYSHKSKMKIFCFPHAGGSATVFRHWINYSKYENYEVIPIEYPGRATRLSEKFMDSVKGEAKRIAKAINNETADSIYILYGHSFGALLAFQTEYELETNYSKYAKVVVVSGRQAPFMEDLSSFRTSMGEQALIEEMRMMRTVDKELLNSQLYLDFFLPIIMNDYKMNEEYIYDNEIIKSSIVAFSSIDDSGAEPEIMKCWKDVTESHFQLVPKTGSHFFVYDEKEIFFKEFLSYVTDEKGVV